MVLVKFHCLFNNLCKVNRFYTLLPPFYPHDWASRVTDEEHLISPIRGPSHYNLYVNISCPLWTDDSKEQLTQR